MARNTLRTSATSEVVRYSCCVCIIVGLFDSLFLQFEGETFEFLWTLKNYFLIDENKLILSPSFRGGPKSNHLWCETFISLNNWTC